MVGTTAQKGKGRKMPLGAINDNVGNTTAHQFNFKHKEKHSGQKVPGLNLKVVRRERAVTDSAPLPEFEIPEKGTTAYEQVMHKMSQREKQISLGKQTSGYLNYSEAIPVLRRDLSIPEHVVTPRASWNISKRRFDNHIRQWRRDLHSWDSPDASTDQNTSLGESDASILSTEGSFHDLPPLVPIPEEEEEFHFRPKEDNEHVITALMAWS
eukprot:TRINITY_DN212_c4_g1_i1.p1 TRINITY_DN212_c4_g1~~TRINITY_DN212_c4_g1_i1.p1  ORF type:complete len:211 (+),score=44.79 TRINITY_DN212_c4_g1_i1:49-681(+)